MHQGSRGFRGSVGTSVQSVCPPGAQMCWRHQCNPWSSRLGQRRETAVSSSATPCSCSSRGQGNAVVLKEPPRTGYLEAGLGWGAPFITPLAVRPLWVAPSPSSWPAFPYNAAQRASGTTFTEQNWPPVAAAPPPAPGSLFFLRREASHLPLFQSACLPPSSPLRSLSFCR